MKTKATLIGFSAILMWSFLALMTAASGTMPPFQLSAITFAIGSLPGIALFIARPERLKELRQPPKVWLAGVGGPTRLAIQMAQEAERLGAKGLLLLPHYLTEASQDGVAAHVEAVCKSVKIGVVVYNRNVCRLTAPLLERLAERCPNLIGYKDGLGDIELMVSIRRRLGDRFSYLGGLPTAEVYAAAYKALGVPVYSSAVFNFIPKTAMDFYHAIAREDHATVGKIIDDFFLPYLDIRNRKAGYAVSIVKAGAKIVGYDAGPVRAPLTDLLPEEYEALAKLVEAQGAQ